MGRGRFRAKVTRAVDSKAEMVFQRTKGGFSLFWGLIFRVSRQPESAVPGLGFAGSSASMRANLEDRKARLN